MAAAEFNYYPKQSGSSGSNQIKSETCTRAYEGIPEPDNKLERHASRCSSSKFPENLNTMVNIFKSIGTGFEGEESYTISRKSLKS